MRVENQAKIFVDWGSSNFRAFLIEGGQVTERCEAHNAGVLRSGELRDSRYFARFLYAQIGGWLKVFPQAHVVLCGSIGSRDGWVDTGYVSAPASLLDLSQALYQISADDLYDMRNYNVSILPGLAIKKTENRFDVMRSEEIKAFGALQSLNLTDAVFCIPGTHCKWVKIKNNMIVDFHTILTGEFYNLIGESGSFARLFNQSETFDFESFDQGVVFSQQGEDVLSDIWQVRARKICDPQAPADMQAFLSGILIGHEIRKMKLVYPDNKEIILLSDEGTRQNCYRRALESLDWKITATVESEASVCAGLLNLCKLL